MRDWYLIIGLSILTFFSFAPPSRAVVPVWVKHFDKCTQFQTSNEQFTVELHTALAAQKQSAERIAVLEDVTQARRDVNILVATVYNELRTQQIVNDPDALNPDLRDVLQSLGIVAVDQKNADNQELCKASYYVNASIGGEPNQCVAVVQEARFITNQDDYIYEEGRRRSMDALFCYLGEWRHFPIANIDDRANCEALGLISSCNDDQIWEELGNQVHGDPTFYKDVDGSATFQEISDDQHVHNLCEGLRALGKKCAQDLVRDYIKYSTIDKFTRKDRTVILAPPQTWYTPDRCRIIESTLPVANQPVNKVASNTPYTKSIKSLQPIDIDKMNSSELLDYYFGSRLGNPTIPKPPANMDASEYTAQKEFQAINTSENNFAGLSSKVDSLVKTIINETSELRKLQYANGDGIRDATLRIGWKDYEWGGNQYYLGKYPALDLPVDDPKQPNKILKPLPCYWEISGTRCEPKAISRRPTIGPTGKTFYFDTGIVISPISITKSKLQSAIQAQFDLAARAFKDVEPKPFGGEFGECGAGDSKDGGLDIILPPPWEDAGVDLSNALNSLTGEPYTYGAPGKDNPPFRIPGLNHNYFNFLYNDIFQLYHTSFPDVLASWFRVNAPEYDSIYGPIEPISFTAFGDPGAGPPDGGGGGGGGVSGPGSGTCTPVASGPCSVAALQNTCFGANAIKASAICNVESGGVATISSGVDRCQPGGESVSWGLFQINLSAHDIKDASGNTLNCAPPGHPAAFSSTYTASNKQCSIEDAALHAQCIAAAKTPSLNIQKACEISNNGENWGAWGANSKCQFSPGEQVHGSCNGNKCVVVSGAGANECTKDSECSGSASAPIPPPPPPPPVPI